VWPKKKKNRQKPSSGQKNKKETKTNMWPNNKKKRDIVKEKSM